MYHVASLLLLTLTLLSRVTPGVTQGEKAFQYNILEERPPDDFIANIILDAKLDIKYSPNDLRLLMFSLHERRGSTLNLKDYFAIEERTGILRTARRIDREAICPHQVQCAAYLNVMVQPGKYFEIITVTINILDLNDNVPTFPKNMVECNVSESSMKGMQIQLPSAEDLDSPAYTIHKYDLLSDSDKFELQVTNNSIGNVDLHLILKGRLDREEEESYLMEVVAVDGGNPPKSGAMMVKVNVLDANDNNPKFDNYSYEVTISENLPVGSTIIQLHAHDPDKGLNGKVEYKFNSATQADYGGLFGIDNETGEVFVKGSIDYERGDSYTLTVTATDKGPNSLPAYAKVLVHVEDMNDHSPHITVNALTTTGYVEVAEDAQMGTFVAHVSVQDFDSGKSGSFRCRMDSPSFDLQQLYPTEFKIITKTSFDREQQAEYHLNMVCRDKGIPPRSATEHIIVTIVDANDHSPQFQHQVYTAELRENNAAGAFITQVVALDRDIGDNARIKYSIVDDDRGLLAIHEDTGIIRANVRFNYEQDQELEFVVEARDQAESPRTARALLRLIIIDSNDEVPAFHQNSYRFSVVENSRARTFVGIVSATDKDAAPYNQITYSLDPDYDGLRSFDINSYTGEITTKRTLDREEQRVFHMIVIASNEGFPLMRRKVNVTVVIEDQNDNSPILDYPNEWNNTVHISRSLPVGGFVARIRAHDLDEGKNSELSYSIFDGNGGKYFFINTSTGVITLSKVLDSEGFQYHKMKVIVKDHGSPQKEALGDFNIIVNKSLAIVQYQNSGFSFFKLKDSQIIIGAIIVIFVLLVLILTVIVVKCKKKRNNRNNKYNCRREAKKRDGKKKDPHRESLEWKAVPNDWNGADMKDEKPKKAVTFRMEVEEGEGEDDHHLWPPNIDSDSTQKYKDSDGTTSCDEDGFTSIERKNYINSSSMRRFPQPEPAEHNHFNGPRPNYPPLTKAELEMHEMLQLLQQDGADSETGSYTDSGRGPSEEGDNANHVNALDPAVGAPAAAAAAAAAAAVAGPPSSSASNHDTSKHDNSTGEGSQQGPWQHRYPTGRPGGTLRSFMPANQNRAGPTSPSSPSRASTLNRTPRDPRSPHRMANGTNGANNGGGHDQQGPDPLWVPRSPSNSNSNNNVSGADSKMATSPRHGAKQSNDKQPNGPSRDFVLLAARFIDDEESSDADATPTTAIVPRQSPLRKGSNSAVV